MTNGDIPDKILREKQNISEYIADQIIDLTKTSE